MKLIAIAVLDLATQTFGRPMFVNHAAQAVRSFIDEVNRPDSEMGRHAKDYELWDCGSFDDAKGTFSGVDPVRIARAVDLIQTSKG